MPDGLTTNSRTGLTIAMEAKYLSRSKGGLRDPDREVKFVNENDIAQAQKYIDKYKGGLLWIVNDERLISKYQKMFLSII